MKNKNPLLKHTLIRTVTREECPWLPHDFQSGDTVYCAEKEDGPWAEPDFKLSTKEQEPGAAEDWFMMPLDALQIVSS